MIEKPANVRFAVPGDAASIYELEWEYSQTSPLIKLFPANPLTLMDDIQCGIKGYQGGPLEGVHLLGLCEDNGKAVGGVDLVIERWFWTRDCLMLRMRWLYVKKGLGAASSLRHFDSLMAFCLWCREHMEADIRKSGDTRPFVLDASFVVAERVDAMDRLWSRYARKAGAIYLVGLPEDA